LCKFVKNDYMRLRVYIDTSVVGGYFGDEFEDDTNEI
jgi:hypothetical protein